jgi:UDP-glucose 4-epimerase
MKVLVTGGAGYLGSLKIFGTDYPTPDGTCIRDYIRVSNLADAHVLGLELLQRQQSETAADGPTEPRLYNLGNGKGFSVQEVISTDRQVTGRDLMAEVAERRPGDPPVLVASSAKARQELGWTPRYADLATIIRHAWAWHQQRFGKAVG